MLAFLDPSATGNIGTPIDVAVSGVTGNPRAAKRSRAVNQTSVAGWYIRPLPVLKVGICCETALQHNRTRGLSPSQMKRSSFSVALPWNLAS